VVVLQRRESSPNMSKIKILLFVWICLAPVLRAQEEKWNELEKERNYINAQIQKGEYLLNELKINANRLAIHHNNEEFQHWEKYFYTFNPRADDNPPILKAVIIKTERDGLSNYKEYMFDNDGNCIYHSENLQNYKVALDEKTRFYMEKGNPVRWFKNDSDITFDSEKPYKIVAQVVETANGLKAKFLKQLGD
jgi:hypothetical protein